MHAMHQNRLCIWLMPIHEADACKRMYILKGTVAVTSTLCLTLVIVLQADKEHSRPPIDSPTPADLGLTSVDQTLAFDGGRCSPRWPANQPHQGPAAAAALQRIQS